MNSGTISPGNRIAFHASVSGDVMPPIAALHNIVHKNGIRDVTIDFDDVTFFSVPYMLCFVTICRNYRREGVNFEFVLPSDKVAYAMLMDTNWLHIICPEKYEASNKGRRGNIPARQFLNPEDHFSSVDEAIEVILRAIPSIRRDNLRALEWALNEITDNVLNHSRSPIGGILQVNTFPRKNRIEFMVCDSGAGIPNSLREEGNISGDDLTLLRLSVDEGVTKNKTTNQGNGLYGTRRCCVVSGGELEVLSGYGRLIAARDEVIVKKNVAPFMGAFVRASIGYRFDRLLDDALVFKGKGFVPSFDYIERAYETGDGAVKLKVIDEIEGVGSRSSGISARNKILNISQNLGLSVHFDFSGITVITSSFADEVFGRIFVEYGEDVFREKCRIVNANETIVGLINRSIELRKGS